MEYTKLFENHSNYEDFVDSGTMVKPNVSYCIQENDVHYNAKIDYSKKYLTFISLEDNNTFYWNVDDVNHRYSGNPILYSLNNGKTWNSVSNGEIATVNSGDKILLKAVNSGYGYNDGTGFIMKCRFSSTSELPATTLANNCYDSMFSSCTSLISAPELPATTLVKGCYQYMFQYCTSLNYIKAMFTTTPSGGSPNYYTSGWVRGVASTGTFVKNSAAQWDVTGVNGVPSGWTVQRASA